MTENKKGFTKKELAGIQENLTKKQSENKPKIKERYFTIAFFFTTLLALALCWTVTQQAHFFCENYCEVQGGYLYSYSPGTSCKCGNIHKITGTSCKCGNIHKITIDKPIDENYTWPGIQ